MIRCAILLSTCAYPHAPSRQSPEQRIPMYQKVIQQWLDLTSLPIFVIDSSGYSFPDIQPHERLHIEKFHLPQWIVDTNCSSFYEGYSIMHTFKTQLNNYDLVIKVTGRYFLPTLEQEINGLPKDVDIVYQHTQNPRIKWQNTEIFGFKPQLVHEIFEDFVYGKTSHKLIEHHLYDIHNKVKSAKAARLPLLGLLEPVKRGGDGMTMRHL